MINDKYMQATNALTMHPAEVRHDTNSSHAYAGQQGQGQGQGQRRLSKVVGFDLPLPAKRQRPSAEITAQNVTIGEFHFDHLSTRIIH